MALPTNTVPLTATAWVGRQVQSFQEAFWTLTFQNPVWDDLLTVIPGIKAKKQIVILGLLDLVGKTMSTAQCAPDISNQTVPDIQKFWNPNVIEDRFAECWKDLLAKFYVWGLKNTPNKADLTATDFAEFLMNRVMDGLMQSVYRIVYFADTAAALYTSGGPGLLTPAIGGQAFDVRYMNAIDGIWKQVFAISAEFPQYHYAIPNNAGNSYANQRFTAADTTAQLITGIMQSISAGADTRLVGAQADPASKPKFWVTRTVMTQLKAERRLFPYIPAAYERQESGFMITEFDGFDVVECDFWDRFIQAYFNNGTTTYLPHRILFGNIGNIQMGVETTDSFTAVEDFYVPESKLYYMDTQYSIDAKIIEDYKISSAY